MTGRLLHLTDLHVGAGDEGRDELEDAVRLLTAELEPEVVLVTGDLTHRNRAAQHERAAAFLRSLERPLLVVPGNHDIPALPPARLSTPFERFGRAWRDLEPSYRSERLAIVALNSVRPLKYQRGALEVDQLEHAASFLREGPPDALRVVALHHHLAAAPWRTGKRSIPRRDRVLRALRAARAELVLSGHTHQACVIADREFLTSANDAPRVVLAVAPGLGRPRPSRHAEASGLNVYEADGAELRARTWVWTGDGFAPLAERCFPRAAAARSP